MTTPLSVFALIVAQTKAEILDLGLSVARLLGLPVDTWRVGDPTRSLYAWQAEQIETSDAVITEYAKAGFLDTAKGPWLELRASDVYGVLKPGATYSTPSITLTNAGGGYYEIEAGGLTVSSQGATFTNQATVTIEPSGEVDALMIAQVAGAAGSVDEDAVDTIVSPTLDGVSITASSASSGADAQSDEGLREQCRATLGALSPDGPADAYEYVARNAELTGVLGVTRAKADGDNTTGTVTVYVASTTASLSGGDVALIQAACEEWAEPLCTECTVVGATSQSIAVALSGVSSSLSLVVNTAVSAYLATVELGGIVSVSALYSALHVALAKNGTPVSTMTLTTPSADVDLAINKFPIKGTVTFL
jgi:uncharacterized phage protein gp47/JayE